MTFRIRGSKRKKLIEKWLNGEEDDEYEVKPTKTEGKFIIKKRQTKELKRKEVEASEHEPDNESNNEPDNERNNEPNNESNNEPNNEQQQRTTTTKHEGSSGSSEQQNTLNQILEQLRLLGERNQQRDERKQRKRETKMILQKQLGQQQYQHQQYQHQQLEERTQVLSASESNNNTKLGEEYKPTYVRRRLNLLNNYR